jgi:uncharacterized protein YkwD
MILRPQSLLCCLIALLLSSFAHAQVVEDHDTEVVTVKAKGEVVDDHLDLKQVAKSIVSQTNEFRASEKREQVAIAPKLTETAQYFADYMARTNRYGHIADGDRPNDRAKKHGYEYCIIAENIAYEYSSEGFKLDDLAKSLTEGWEHSPGHRKNMLDRDVTETGVAVAWSKETGHYYAVQMFGRPKSLAIEFQIANESESTVQYKIDEQTFPLPPRLIRTHHICRPSAVTFIWSDAKDDQQVITPKTHERFRVTKAGDKLEVKQEVASSN